MTEFDKKAADHARGTDDWIDGLLGDASVNVAMPTDDLMARVLGDAVQAQALRQVPRAPVQTSIWAQLGQMIGGWPALGGLAAAGVAGLWIGVAPPTELETFAADVLGTTEAVDLMGTGFAAIFEEGIDG